MSQPSVAELMSMLSEMQTKLSHLETEVAQTRAQAPAVQSVQEKSTSRRRMLKKLGAGMLVAGVAASAGLASQTQTAQAGIIDKPIPNIGSIIAPTNTVTSNEGAFPANRYLGLLGTVETNVNFATIPGTGNAGVLGYSYGNASGVYGYSSISYAVYGESNNGEGVHAKSIGGLALAAESTNGYGIMGKSLNSHAIVGEGTAGYGVWAKSSGSHGLVAETASSNTNHYGIWAKGSNTALLAESPKNAVVGNSFGGTGVAGATTNGIAVQGVSTGLSGVAVQAIAQQSGFGVYATAANGVGVYSVTTNGTAIQGTSGSGYGVYGESSSTSGIFGRTTAANQVGVFGTSDGGHGVRGVSVTQLGVQGQSSSGHGVRGVSQTGYGVYGTSDSGTGIVAGSTTGVPFRIVPGNQPTSGTRVVGEMYADSAGNLWFYNGTAWKKVVLA